MTIIVINQNILNYAIVTKLFAYILPYQNFVKKLTTDFTMQNIEKPLKIFDDKKKLDDLRQQFQFLNGRSYILSS